MHRLRRCVPASIRPTGESAGVGADSGYSGSELGGAPTEQHGVNAWASPFSIADQDVSLDASMYSSRARSTDSAYIRLICGDIDDLYGRRRRVPRVQDDWEGPQLYHPVQSEGHRYGAGGTGVLGPFATEEEREALITYAPEFDADHDVPYSTIRGALSRPPYATPLFAASRRAERRVS